MKYSSAFERDYKFYHSNFDKFSFSGRSLPNVKFAESGLNAKRCFYIYDSIGKTQPCCEPELLQRLLTCKASVNLNIKLWSQGIKHNVLCPPELQEYLESIDAPEWLLKSALKQGEKYLLEQSRERQCNLKT